MAVITWTYSGDPAHNDRDAVRFMIGDTDPDTKKLNDNEIDYLINSESNLMFAAAEACKHLATRYGGRSDKSVGDLRLSYSQLQKNYLERAQILEDHGAIHAGGNIFAGGISKSKNDAENERSDRVTPAFSIGSMDDKRAGDNPINLSPDDYS